MVQATSRNKNLAWLGEQEPERRTRCVERMNTGNGGDLPILNRTNPLGGSRCRLVFKPNQHNTRPKKIGRGGGVPIPVP